MFSKTAFRPNDGEINIKDCGLHLKNACAFAFSKLFVNAERKCPNFVRR